MTDEYVANRLGVSLGCFWRLEMWWRLEICSCNQSCIAGTDSCCCLCKVYLTDHEDKVLQNLRDCVAANFPLSSNSDNGTAAAPADTAVAADQQSNDGLYDPEDAESCDDLEDFLAPASNNAQAASSNMNTWDFVSAPSSAACLILMQKHMIALATMMCMSIHATCTTTRYARMQDIIRKLHLSPAKDHHSVYCEHDCFGCAAAG